MGKKSKSKSPIPFKKTKPKSIKADEDAKVAKAASEQPAPEDSEIFNGEIGETFEPDLTTEEGRAEAVEILGEPVVEVLYTGQF